MLVRIDKDTMGFGLVHAITAILLMNACGIDGRALRLMPCEDARVHVQNGILAYPINRYNEQ